jgi:hypothetical protein
MTRGKWIYKAALEYGQDRAMHYSDTLPCPGDYPGEDSFASEDDPGMSIFASQGPGIVIRGLGK